MSESVIKSLGVNASTCSYSDILSSDLILVFGCDLVTDYPIIALKVREAVDKGSRLIMANPRATMMDSLSEITLKVNRQTGVDLLDAILGYILSYELINHDFISSHTRGFRGFAKAITARPVERIADIPWVRPSKIIEAIHLYVRARNPVIIVNADTITPIELAQISDLALVTGNTGRSGAGIVLLHSLGNAQGLIDMGVSPNYLPGQRPITDSVTRQKLEAAWGNNLPAEEGRDPIGIIQGLEKGEIHGLLAIGSDATGEIGNAIFEVPLFSVLLGTVFPQEPPYPDVILPGANFAESEGTYTNCERRIQRLNRAMPAPAGKPNWEILSMLANSLDYQMNYPTVSSIYEEITRLVPLYKAAKGNEAAGEGKQWPFSRGRRFDFESSLAQLRLSGLMSPEIMELLGSLS